MKQPVARFLVRVEQTILGDFVSRERWERTNQTSNRNGCGEQIRSPQDSRISFHSVSSGTSSSCFYERSRHIRMRS
jgi:hypothetical protein